MNQAYLDMIAARMGGNEALERQKALEYASLQAQLSMLFQGGSSVQNGSSVPAFSQTTAVQVQCGPLPKPLPATDDGPGYVGLELSK